MNHLFAILDIAPSVIRSRPIDNIIKGGGLDRVAAIVADRIRDAEGVSHGESPFDGPSESSNQAESSSVRKSNNSKEHCANRTRNTPGTPKDSRCAFGPVRYAVIRFTNARIAESVCGISSGAINESAFSHLM